MKVFSATDIGQKRTMNQDFVFASASPILLRVTVFLYWWNL